MTTKYPAGDLPISYEVLKRFFLKKAAHWHKSHKENPKLKNRGFRGMEAQPPVNTLEELLNIEPKYQGEGRLVVQKNSLFVYLDGYWLDYNLLNSELKTNACKLVKWIQPDTGLVVDFLEGMEPPPFYYNHPEFNLKKKGRWEKLDNYLLFKAQS